MLNFSNLSHIFFFCLVSFSQDKKSQSFVSVDIESVSIFFKFHFEIIIVWNYLK